jgi:DNA-binding NtrC family response regulator
VRKVDVRILAATHRPLRELVENGAFRQDLYYRLNVIPIHVPPLRERREDIPDLAAEFLRSLAKSMGKSIKRITPEALRVLMDHRWPGNVRELRNAIEHAAVKCRGSVLLLEDLPRELIEESVGIVRLARGARERGGRREGSRGRAAQREMTESVATSLKRRAEREREEILEALERTAWKRGEAAKLLGIDRSTLWRRMRKLGIE